MLRCLVCLLTLLVFVSASFWPEVQEIERGNVEISIHPDEFSITLCKSSTLLNSAVDRYKSFLFPFGKEVNLVSFYSYLFVLFIYRFMKNSDHAKLKYLEICVDSTDDDLFIGIDESYTLEIFINEKNLSFGATIYAKNTFGGIRGLETFSQLIKIVDPGTNKQNYLIQDVPLMINDAPRFMWR